MFTKDLYIVSHWAMKNYVTLHSGLSYEVVVERKTEVM
jgi:hypothetical protein